LQRVAAQHIDSKITKKGVEVVVLVLSVRRITGLSKKFVYDYLEDLSNAGEVSIKEGVARR